MDVESKQLLVPADFNSGSTPFHRYKIYDIPIRIRQWFSECRMKILMDNTSSHTMHKTKPISEYTKAY